MSKATMTLDLQALVQTAQSYTKLGKADRASKVFREAIQAFPNHHLLKLHAALHFLGQGNLSYARDLVEAVLKKTEHHLGAIKCLGLIRMQEGKLSDALECWRRALQIDESDEEALSNYAMTLFQAGDYEESETIYKIIFASRAVVDDSVKYNFGLLLIARRRYLEALRVFEPLVKNQGLDKSALLTNMAACHIDNGSCEEARPIIRELFDITYIQNYSHPMPGWISEVVDQLIFLITLPPVFSSQNHYETLIELVDQCLVRLSEIIENNSSEIGKYRNFWIYGLLRVSNFHLAYFQYGDVEWNKTFSRITQKLISPPTFHRYRVKKENDVSGGKLKVLFISQYFGLHAVKWVVDLVRLFEDRVDMTFHFLNADFGGDWATEIKAKYEHQDYELDESSLVRYVETTQAKGFDWAIFPDVGMTPISRVLSQCRLAKRQLVHWAHPVTTGSEAMDYFLSVGLMEPSRERLSNSPYTERLINMPGFGLWLPPRKWTVQQDEIPELISRRLSNPRGIRICTIQSLWKYLPKYDWIWVKLLMSLPENFYLSFLMLDGAESNQRFQARILAYFEMNYPAGLSRLEFSPRMDREDYISHLSASFINVDSYGWSGGNTFLDACDTLLPTLTCRSELMRGNHSAAGLDVIGVSEFVIDKPDTYADSILRLFGNSDHYSRLLGRIEQGRHNLIGDERVRDAFGEFLFSE